MSTHVSYWLEPAREHRAGFEDLIAALAAELDAPPFRPHLTVYSGPGNEAKAAAILARAAAGLGPIALTPRGVEESSLYTKTLFLSFEDDPGLSQLSDRLRALSPPAEPGEGYRLAPHLSLLYKSLSAERRLALPAKVQVVPGPVVFDALSAISTPTPVESAAEVEAWRDLARVELAG